MMKRLGTCGVVAAMAVFLLFLSQGCANPLGQLADRDAVTGTAPDGSLEVRFDFGSPLQAVANSRTPAKPRTLYPNDDPNYFNPNRYDVQANGPSGNLYFNFSSRTGYAAGFLPGAWNFVVRAYRDSIEIANNGAGQSAVLRTGASNQVNLLLQPSVDPAQYGSVNINVSLDVPVASPSLTISMSRLKPADSYSPTISLTRSGNTYSSFLASSVPAGMYVLNAVLTDGGSVVWGETEIAYVAQYVTTTYAKTVSATSLGQSPTMNPTISLDSGVIVDEGGVGTDVWLDCPEPDVLIAYTTNGDDPICVNGSITTGSLYSGGPITLRAGMADATGTIKLRAKSFNVYGYGPSPVSIAEDYYPSDAVYADANYVGTSQGNAARPYLYLNDALDRAAALRRGVNTTVKAAKGLYTGNFTLQGGVTLSGSYTASYTPSVTWNRVVGSLDQPKYYGYGNETILGCADAPGGADPLHPGATLVVVNIDGKDAGIEYVGINGPSNPLTGIAFAALHVGYFPALLSVNSCSIVGASPSSYDSYGASVNSQGRVSFTDCHIMGRGNAGSGATLETAGLRVSNSAVDVSCSGLSSEIGPYIGDSAGNCYGIHALGGASIRVTGTSSNRALIHGPVTSGCGYFTGVALEGGSSGTLSNVTVDIGNEGPSVTGISFDQATGRVEDCSVLINIPFGTVGQAVGISCRAPTASYLPSAAADFTILGGMVVNTCSGTVINGESAGIVLLSGKASIQACVSVEGGAVIDGPGAASYGIKVAPSIGDWVDASISGVQSIEGGDARYSYGLYATGAVRLALDNDYAVFSSSANMSAAAWRCAVSGDGISRIPGSAAGDPMLRISDLPQIFCLDPSSMHGTSVGLSLALSDPDAPVLVERSKISGGFIGAGGTLYGVQLNLNESAAPHAFDIVFRNDMVFRGEGAAAGGAFDVYRPTPYASGRVILANDTVISAGGGSGCPALRLSGYAAPVLINDILLNTSSLSYVLEETSSTAAPSAALNNAFLSQATLYWYDDASMSLMSLNTAVYLNNLGLDVGAYDPNKIFQNPYPAALADFNAFTGALDPAAPGGAAALIRTGGLDASAYASLDPWRYSTDYGNRTRTPGWSMGAVE